MAYGEEYDPVGRALEFANAGATNKRKNKMDELAQTHKNTMEQQKDTQAFEKPLKDAYGNYYNSVADQNKEETKVYREVGLPMAQDELKNQQNTTGLNIKYGARDKETGIKAKEALTNDLLEGIKDRKEANKIARLNVGGVMQGQIDATEQAARATTQSSERRRNFVRAFEPFGAGTSGADNSAFVDQGREELLLPKRGTADRVVQSLIPFSRAFRAKDIKSKLLASPVYTNNPPTK
jgi:hypothetical protein